MGIRRREERNVIRLLLRRKGYNHSDAVRLLCISDTIFRKKLTRPSLFSVNECMKLAGLIGIDVHVLIYCLLHFKDNTGRNEEEKESLKWYIDDIVYKGKEVLKSIDSKEE